MSRSSYFTMFGMLLTCFAGEMSAFGQASDSSFAKSNPSHFYGQNGYYGWGVGYHASTAAEGYARGLADVIRAKGESNLLNALAQREWETARHQQLENKVLKVKSFYVRRELFANKRAAQLAQTLEKRETRLERMRLTDLSHEEFDRTSGEVNWPTLLADEAFSDYRGWFDAVLAERAKYGRVSAGTLGEAELLIKQWRAELTAVKDQVPSSVLRDNLRFLLRLNRELVLNLS